MVVISSIKMGLKNIIFTTMEGWEGFHIIVPKEISKDFEYVLADIIEETYKSIVQGIKFKKFAVLKDSLEFVGIYRVQEASYYGQKSETPIQVDIETNENSFNLYFKNGIQLERTIRQMFRDNFSYKLRELTSISK